MIAVILSSCICGLLYTLCGWRMLHHSMKQSASKAHWVSIGLVYHSCINTKLSRKQGRRVFYLTQCANLVYVHLLLPSARNNHFHLSQHDTCCIRLESHGNPLCSDIRHSQLINLASVIPGNHPPTLASVTESKTSQNLY